jgi:hypothetical protein
LCNAHVNQLIGDIRGLEAEGDNPIGDSVYVGDPAYLVGMAAEKDAKGNYKNSDLYQIFKPLVSIRETLEVMGKCIDDQRCWEEERRKNPNLLASSH